MNGARYIGIHKASEYPVRSMRPAIEARSKPLDSFRFTPERLPYRPRNQETQQSANAREPHLFFSEIPSLNSMPGVMMIQSNIRRHYRIFF